MKTFKINLEDQVPGALLHYMSDRQISTFARAIEHILITWLGEHGYL